MKRSSWILLILLVVVIGAYILIKLKNEKSSATATETTSTTSYLIQETASTLLRIRMYDQDYHIVELQRNTDGLWELNLPSAGAADTAKASEAETQLQALRIVTDIGSVPSLADFGLTFPTSTIKLVYSGDIEHKIEVGNLTPTGSGYYVQLDDKGVYVVSSYSIDSLLALITTPPYPATSTPEPTAEGFTPTP